MATQTQNQRKAAAQKAAATRRRNAANRKRSAQKAAETRAKGELNAVQSVALQGQEIGQRAIDFSLGAALETRDRVTGAIRPITSATERRRLGRNARSTLRSLRRRGAQARGRAERTARTQVRETERQATKARREAARRTTRARRDVERGTSRIRSGAEEIGSAAGDLAGRS